MHNRPGRSCICCAVVELHCLVDGLIWSLYCRYNVVLRSMATESKTVSHGMPQSMLGLSVQDRFITTLHAINSGVIKLSRLQPACEVYRGLKGLKLPRSFVTANSHNVRGGVENSFLSATLDFEEARKYSCAGPGEPSVLFRMRMGMVNRGAYLGWLSQYPGEREILLPPLTGLEMQSFTKLRDGTLLYTMDLNINLQSKTIEEVLAVRKKQCVELAGVVQRSLEREYDELGGVAGVTAYDGAVTEQRDRIQTLLHQARRQLRVVEARDSVDFNENSTFVSLVNSVMQTLPNEEQRRYEHVGLVRTTRAQLLHKQSVLGNSSQRATALRTLDAHEARVTLLPAAHFDVDENFVESTKAVFDAVRGQTATTELRTRQCRWIARFVLPACLLGTLIMLSYVAAFLGQPDRVAASTEWHCAWAPEQASRHDAVMRGGCEVGQQSVYTRGVDYVQTAAVLTATRQSEAVSAACRAYPNCTGFTLGVGNGSAALWLNHACSGPMSKGWSAAAASDIRLVPVGGTPLQRVELYQAGEWSTVSAEGFDERAADVACRQLGYRDGAVSHGRVGEYLGGKGSGPVLFDPMACAGDEQRLQDCGRKANMFHSHSYDVGLHCRGLPPTGSAGACRPWAHKQRGKIHA